MMEIWQNEPNLGAPVRRSVLWVSCLFPVLGYVLV